MFAFQQHIFRGSRSGHMFMRCRTLQNLKHWRGTHNLPSILTQRGRDRFFFAGTGEAGRHFSLSEFRKHVFAEENRAEKRDAKKYRVLQNVFVRATDENTTLDKMMCGSTSLLCGMASHRSGTHICKAAVCLRARYFAAAC